MGELRRSLLLLPEQYRKKFLLYSVIQRKHRCLKPGFKQIQLSIHSNQPFGQTTNLLPFI